MAYLVKAGASIAAHVTPPSPRQKFTLKELQGYVGGYVEQVTLADGRLMFMDEDGKAKGKPFNELATIYLHAAGGSPDDHVVGDVLICKRREVA